jgi:putative tryptophan/tyrosine transport system substrate-binding protein
VAVIVATGIAMPALKAATASIPIIFVTGYDPIRTGFVTSLSRPGGNITGVVFTITDLMAKRLGLLPILPGGERGSVVDSSPMPHGALPGDSGEGRE